MTSIKGGELKARRKPVFGPPVTPEIFDFKWNAKFRSINSGWKIYDTPTTLAELVSSTYSVVQQGLVFVPYIHFCYREAKVLGLCLSEIEQLEANPSLIQSALVAALAHQFNIQNHVAEFQTLKNGGHACLRWQDLPLRLRRHINNLLEMIRAEEEKGYWPVDDKARELSKFVEDWIRQTMKTRNAFGNVKHLKAED